MTLTPEEEAIAAEVKALVLASSERCEREHGGVLPDCVFFGKRPYGRGFRWIARNSAVEASFPSDQRDAAWREAWWLAFCELDYRKRQELER